MNDFSSVALKIMEIITSNSSNQAKLEEAIKGCNEERICEAAMAARVSRQVFLAARSICSSLGMEDNFDALCDEVLERRF